jgi:hypothetical protein
MKRTLLITMSLLATILAPPDGRAAWPRADPPQVDIPEGSRIRISSRTLGLRGNTGTVAVTGERGLVVELDQGGRTPVPYPEVERMDICYRERGTVYGAAAGMGLGILLVSFASFDSHDFSADYQDDSLGALLLGATAGAAVGAIIGYSITYESWRPLIWYENHRSWGRTMGVGFSTVLRTDP